MTAHPQKLASDAAETSDVPAHSSEAQFLAHVDDLERVALEMIEAGKAKIFQGNAQLETCRALRALRFTSETANMASDLLSVSNVARIFFTSEEAIRKAAWRKKVGVKLGGRVFIHRSALGALYLRRRSSLP